MVRINKYLASCELGSRRKVEELVNKGCVSVNNLICKDLSTQIDPTNDIVRVNNKIVKYNHQKLFILLNKPRGYVVTKKDEYDRKTIYDLLPEFASKLHPVGRLDFESEGLLLLTNDGNMTNRITHPVYNIEKSYKVIVKGKMEMDKIIQLRNGIQLEKYKTQTAKVYLKNSSEEKSELKITIKEGKNRQIRKMLDAVGHEVISLKRIQIGQIKLDKLPIGSWRFLKDIEILYLLKQTKIKETKV
ncbi:MAG: rRNA pseudouridine synthase [Candidatus Cloacimonetes bacterium]|nr:rRNA pseudouridine synthase [Candidatus Cloacimonadota bacterium]